tara:strand:+ start:414 stop:578 length:165 start_codon:yes stop_codon:yes gene_type:complete
MMARKTTTLITVKIQFSQSSSRQRSLETDAVGNEKKKLLNQRNQPAIKQLVQST